MICSVFHHCYADVGKYFVSFFQLQLLGSILVVHCSLYASISKTDTLTAFYILYVIVTPYISDDFPFLVVCIFPAALYYASVCLHGQCFLGVYCCYFVISIYLFLKRKQLIILAARLICNCLHSIGIPCVIDIYDLVPISYCIITILQYVDFFVYFCLCELPFLTVHICQCRYLQSISAYVQNCSCCGILNIISVP